MKPLLFILTIAISLNLYSQDLNARIQVSGQQVQGSTNRQKFQTLQKDLHEFISNHRWTNHVFSAEERIECTFQINISKEISSDKYEATLQIQANRPVYGTNLNTVLINHRDADVQFQYVEHQAMEFNETTHGNNLISIMAYWCYIIIGMDYDSFSPQGGSEYFAKAENIVNNAQNASQPGWKSFENDKNRYWIIQNIMDSKYSGIRNFIYQYHRQGLDRMSEKVTIGRTTILTSLKSLQKVYREKPSPRMPYLQLIFNAKTNEFINIFSEGPPNEKNQAYNILTEINPANISKYKKMKEHQ